MVWKFLNISDALLLIALPLFTSAFAFAPYNHIKLPIGGSRRLLRASSLLSIPINRHISTKMNGLEITNAEFCEDCSRNSSSKELPSKNVIVEPRSSEETLNSNPLPLSGPRVTIEYCTGCRWLLRAGWTAQELLTTFEKELAEVAIRPGKVTGVFNVWVDSDLVWNRTEVRRFPEMKELKQKIRDVVNPERGLGHSDK